MTLRAVLVALVIAFGVGCGQVGAPPPAVPTAAPPPPIGLPPVLAIELPAPGRTEIAPDAAPLKDLLESATSSGLRVTHDQTRSLPVGATEVTWTAWSGAPGASVARFTRRAHVYVFPFGQTPVGWSRRHNSTAGNHASKIARDSAGGVHMAWLEDDKPGSGVLYRRGVHDPANGVVTWETAPVRVSDDRSGGGYLALEASANAVHLAWYGRERMWYRRLVRAGNEWRFDSVRDIGAGWGNAGDTGPDIGVRGDAEIHLLSYAGHYAVSTNGGARWRVEQVPWPGGEKKNPGMAVDAVGNAHVVFTLKVRTPPRGFSGGRPSGGYWQLRYVRRQAAGGWTDAQDALAGAPQWADRGEGWDTLADWADIAVDRRGDVHVGFHGTANTGIYGRDEPFYIRRPSRGPGAWTGWDQPVSLHPVNPAARHSYGFAPSLSLDADGDAVVAVVFFARPGLPGDVFDSDALVLRGGRIVGAPILLTRMAETAQKAGRDANALTTWFPAAAPRLYRRPDGRVWLDMLESATPPRGARRADLRHLSPGRCDRPGRRRAGRALTGEDGAIHRMRQAARVVGLGVLATLLITVEGAPQHGKHEAAPMVIPELSKAARDGKVAYDLHCVRCHGPNASGSTQGPPLVHRVYGPGHHGDEAFRLAVRRGTRAHHWRFGDMPPVPGITDPELAAVIHYVRELQRANKIK